TSEKRQGHTYLQPLSCSRTDCQDPSLSALARNQTRQDRHDCFDSIAGYSIPDHSYEAHCMTRKLLCEKRRMYEQKIYPLDFEIIDPIHDIETIAVNTSIRDLDRLKKMYGKGRWRKLLGAALLERRIFSGFLKTGWCWVYV